MRDFKYTYTQESTGHTLWRSIKPVALVNNNEMQRLVPCCAEPSDSWLLQMVMRTVLSQTAIMLSAASIQAKKELRWIGVIWPLR
jgi:hypothetical protein